MIKLIPIYLFSLVIVTACNDATPAEDQTHDMTHEAIDNPEVYINGEELKSYYLPNSFQIQDDYLVEVIQDQATFEKFLHPAATMGSTFRLMDFNKEFVLVIAGKTSDLKPHFNIEKISKNGNTLHVHLKEVKETVPESFSITPLWAYSFPKDGVSKIMVAINDYTTEKSVN